MEVLVDDGFAGRLVDGDPWTPRGVLTVERVERWEIWLDGRRSRG